MRGCCSLARTESRQRAKAIELLGAMLAEIRPIRPAHGLLAGP
jgi:hypothetical protein